MKLSAKLLLFALFPQASSAFLTFTRHNAASSTSQLFMGADEFAFKTVSAAEKYSGGPVEVDMNLYNLDLEQASNEWTATLVQNSVSKPDGVYLDVKSNALIYFDTLTFPIVRKEGQGLGIELLELAGGRNDGVGITVVSGLVEGGVSESSGLVPGDSITKMVLVSGKLETEVAEIKTECCDWGKTVESIGSLPPSSSAEDEKILVTVKRLRRKPTVSVTVQQADEKTKNLQVFAGENLRQAMLNRGVQINDKYAKAFLAGDGTGDCGADGGCCLCTMAVTEGAELLNKPDESEKKLLKEDNCRLSCRSIVGYGMKEGTLKVQLKGTEK